MRHPQRTILLGVLFAVAMAVAVARWAGADAAAPPTATAGDAAGPAVPPAAGEAPLRAAVAAPPPAANEPSVTAAATAAAAPAELTAAECLALRRWLGEGELEVLVRRGRDPVADAAVTVWPPFSSRQQPWLQGEAPLRQGRSDGGGRVVFGGLAAGQVTVRVAAGGDVAGAEADVGRTCVVLFGAQAIRGSVRDDRGTPLAGVPVFTSGVGPLPSRAAVTTTATDGSFVFAHLVTGRYHVQLQRDTLPFPAGERMVTLRAGERSELHFGGVVPRGGVRGRVVDARGDTIPGRHALRAHEATRNDERRVYTLDDGTFALPLPPGTWHFATHETALAEGAPLGLATVAEQWLDMALTLPGIRLVFQLLGPAAAAVPLTDVSLRFGVDSLAPAGEFARDGVRHVHWLGLAPGDYELRLHNHVRILDASGEGFAFALPAARLVDQRVLNLAH